MKAGLLDASLKPWPARDDPEPHGISGEADLAGAWLDTGQPAVLLRDLDKHDESGAAAKSVKLMLKRRPGLGLNETSTSRDGRVRTFAAQGTNGLTELRVVLIGLRGDATLAHRGVTEEFTLDDYVLRLLLDEAVYDAFRGKEDISVPSAVLHKKLGEMCDLLKNNGIPATSSAQLVTMACAAIHCRLARATLVERLIARAPKEPLELLLQPWLEDMRAATA